MTDILKNIFYAPELRIFFLYMLCQKTKEKVDIQDSTKVLEGTKRGVYGKSKPSRRIENKNNNRMA